MVYEYLSKDGELVERDYPMGEAPPRAVLDDGTIARRLIRAPRVAVKNRDIVRGTWPMKSEAAGCHPEQIPVFQEHLRRSGAATDYTPDGRPIFTSRKHRKKACEALGFHDRNGGYGDPQPKGKTNG